MDPRRRRRRCISMVPEIGDDIVRWVQLEKESLPDDIQIDIVLDVILILFKCFHLYAL